MGFYIYLMVGACIIMFLWEKGKRDVLFVAFNVAFIVSNAIVMFKEYDGTLKDLALFDYIIYVSLYSVGIIFMFLVLKVFIDLSKQEGANELQKEKCDYEKLIKKENLDKNETIRLKYVTKVENKNNFKYREFDTKP